MADTTRRAGLHGTVFLAGAGTLAVEILAIRQMVPAFGNSIFIWGAVLSITLLCLALGYSWGGRLGDRLPHPPARLVLHILVSAAWIGALPLWDGLLLRLGLWAGPFLGPIVAAVGLLACPMTLLATVVPLAFRGSYAEDPSRPGGTVGDLFAVSTAGSVAGALLTAYLAVPLLGVSRSFFVTAGLLFLTVLPRLWQGRSLWVAVGLLAVLAGGRALPADLGSRATLREGVRFVHRSATRYAQLDVLQDDRNGSRALLLDGGLQSWVVGKGWARSRLHYVRTALELIGRHEIDGGRALVVGLGAGTLVRRLGERGFEVEVVEIDGGVVEAARDWFAFPSDRFPVHVDDGRAWLNRAARRGEAFDLIVLDAFGGGSHPEHLFSRGAFEAVRDCLSPGGLLVVNTVTLAAPPRNELFLHTSATLAGVFAHVEALDVDPWATRRGRLTNVLLTASDRPRSLPLRDPAPYRALDIDRGARAVTDDWNPMPLWSARAAAEWHAEIARWFGDAVLVPE